MRSKTQLGAIPAQPPSRKPKPRTAFVPSPRARNAKIHCGARKPPAKERRRCDGRKIRSIVNCLARGVTFVPAGPPGGEKNVTLKAEPTVKSLELETVPPSLVTPILPVVARRGPGRSARFTPPVPSFAGISGMGGT